MLSDPTTRLAAVGAVFAALYAAHQVADHWIQTPHQAAAKGLPGWPGRSACAAHVITYTATALLALVVLALSTGWHSDGWRAGAGLAISAISHYIADRRTPLRRLADLVGKDQAWLESGGMYALDQSWHVGWLFVAALVIAAV